MRMNVEKEGKNTMGKSREKYHMLYGIVPYGIGIVPYGIWYRTIRYWASRVKRLHVCVKRRLASFISTFERKTAFSAIYKPKSA
jgi:hypothetical protein